MYYHSFSAVLHGMEACIVNVEVDISEGLPLFSLVGLLSSEVKEAKERVKISIKNSGYRIPAKHITVNLSPADIRKDGTAFDLPIAVALLAAFGYLDKQKLEETVFAGELSLNGTVNSVNGVLPIVYAAMKQGFKTCIVPKNNAKEGAMVQGVCVIGVESLQEVVEYLKGNLSLLPYCVDDKEILQQQGNYLFDFSEVSGQETIKRALEVAVSGMHNILMIGPPGAGKTMLAKRVPSIMPELTFEESLEISKVYSISGLLDNEHAFVWQRPFRSPHHSVTATALVGGGKTAKPGEICLANGGVLFLDELPEFGRDTIELLRQPLEDRAVTITRLNGSYRYPTGFMLIAAMNPCRCGYFPDRNRCSCTSNQVKKYLGKISMPLLDRIDICAEATEVNYKDLERASTTETSEIIRKRVQRVRKIQMKRYQNEKFFFNGELSAKDIKKYCVLGNEEKEFLETVYSKMNLSARAYHRILKVSRTIADLAEEERITIEHLSEALCYRSIDKKYWE